MNSATLGLRLLSLCGLLLTGCNSLAPAPAAVDGPVVSEIHVVSHGWHAGIVVRRTDIPEAAWPEKRDFPDADYLEVGWGDRDYYQSRDPGLGTTLKAALWPTASVLHIAGIRGAVADYFPHSTVITIPVTQSGLLALIEYIDASHERPDRHPHQSLGLGLYGDSRYYPARGSFHLFNNCNRWTARALRAAGLAVSDAITVGGLLVQLERYTTPAGEPPK